MSAAPERVPIVAGIEWLRTEQEVIEAEVVAFRTFAEAVTEAGSTLSSPAVRDLHVMRYPAGASTTSSESMERLRRAYRTTVMATPHYRQEYGDSFTESFLGEFHPDAATAFLHATELTHHQVDLLQREVAGIIDNRVSLAKLLVQEEQALQCYLEEIDRLRSALAQFDACEPHQWTTNALHIGWRRLRTLGDWCESIAADRQRTLHKYVEEHGEFGDNRTFEQYMFPTLTTNYPCLSALAVLGAAIEETTQQFQDELIDRAVDAFGVRQPRCAD